MVINSKNLLCHELIGLEVEVAESLNPSLKGKKGVIMDETRNTLTIKEGKSLKVIPKNEVTLSISTPKGEDVKVKGRKLEARPENRIKKLR